MRLVLAAAALVLPLLAAVPADAAPETTCQGQAATIVGQPGEDVSGTPGDDVIVTNGALHTVGLAGDDLICVTGSWYRPEVLANGGDDTVVAISESFPDVSLGAGADLFRNLSGREASVDAGDDAGLADDVIVSEVGGLTVVSGVVGRPNGDTIQLGSRRDVVHLNGIPTATVDGGADEDALHLATTAPAAWVVDRPADAITVDGAPLDVHGFENYDVSDLAWSSFDFTGSDDADQLRAVARGRTGEGRPFSARMGHGRDRVTVVGWVSGPVAGGPARDYLDLASGAPDNQPGPDLSIDLGAGVVQIADRDELTATSFEIAPVDRFDEVEVTGSEQRDYIVVQACGALVDGLSGNDTIFFTRRTHCAGPGRHSLTAYGRDGNDRLLGSDTDDRLYGGAGNDATWGRAGRDICRAERLINCEI